MHAAVTRLAVVTAKIGIGELFVVVAELQDGLLRSHVEGLADGCTRFEEVLNAQILCASCPLMVE